MGCGFGIVEWKNHTDLFWIRLDIPGQKVLRKMCVEKKMNKTKSPAFMIVKDRYIEES